MSSLQKRALHAQHNNIRASLNPDSIIPYLNQQDLLTNEEFEKLCGRALTRSEKIDLIVQVLPSIREEIGGTSFCVVLKRVPLNLVCLHTRSW